MRVVCKLSLSDDWCQCMVIILQGIVNAATLELIDGYRCVDDTEVVEKVI